MNLKGTWINSKEEIIIFSEVINNEFRYLSFYDENGNLIKEVVPVKRTSNNYEKIVHSNRLGICDIVILSKNNIYINKIKYTRVME